MKSAAGGLDEAVARAVEVKGVKVLTHRADELERGQLRTLVDNLKQKLGEGVVVLGSAQPEGKSGDYCRSDAGVGWSEFRRESWWARWRRLWADRAAGRRRLRKPAGKISRRLMRRLKAVAGIVGEMLG